MSESKTKKVLWTILKCVVWVFVILFALGIFLTIDEDIFPLIDFGVVIVSGWFIYLERVIPQVTFNKEIAFDALIALSLAIFGLHRILGWWAKHQGKDSPKWRISWTLKITAMVLMLFATSIAATGIIHQTGWLFHEENTIINGGIGIQARELSNLKQVGLALRLFAADHQGTFPRELSELVPDYMRTNKLLFTQPFQDGVPEPIIYYRGYTDGDPPDTIIVASPRPRDSSRGVWRTVAFLDDSAEIKKEAEFQMLIQKQEAARKGVSPSLVAPTAPIAP